MTRMTRQELVHITKRRYLKAGKREKTKILDEFCQNAGLNRKYSIHIFQAGYETNRIAKEGRKKRRLVYGTEVMAVVVKIWELLEFPCGARLAPVLLSTAEQMERCKELILSDEIREKLGTIKPKTLDRRLKREREVRRLKRNRGTTRHGSLLKSSILIRITNWDTNELGFMEMDTVAHNGGDPSGEFICSLDMVEICSWWSEQRAVMGKGERGIVRAIEEVKASVPFLLKGLDSDTGSEFVNWHLVNYCERNQLFFTRSRPEMKNDNAYVEQKNYTHVRQWLGYRRYDTETQLMLINDLYRNELRLFNNFFRPVMKIKSKEKVNNSVCRKTYDVAKTPYTRVLERIDVPEETKQRLRELYFSLNPVSLKKRIDEKLKRIRNS